MAHELCVAVAHAVSLQTFERVFGKALTVSVILFVLLADPVLVGIKIDPLMEEVGELDDDGAPESLGSPKLELLLADTVTSSMVVEVRADTEARADAE